MARELSTSYFITRCLRYFTVICRIQNMMKKYLRLWKHGRGALGYTKKVSDFEGLRGRFVMSDIETLLAALCKIIFQSRRF